MRKRKGEGSRETAKQRGDKWRSNKGEIAETETERDREEDR